jgi:hypothetical protein
MGVSVGPLGRVSGELLILLVALPALLSPLIVLPLPEETSPALIAALKMLLPMCGYPRTWALAASAAAALWAWRGPAAWWRKALGAGIAALAWIPATYTASTMAALVRF